MSSALAIGAVSAVLRNLLDNGVVDAGPGIGTIDVTSIAPDLVKVDDPDAAPRLNLFLYRVTPNQGWSNVGLPTYNGNGTRLANPPLALDLHYLLTAYGNSDFQAEILLGYGMYVLHERPVLDRAAIRRALNPSPLGPSILPVAFQALSASDLADQVESITVSLEPTDTEEMSRLWTALQAHYRPTAAYVVSVVLIEATRPGRSPLPVLSRGPIDPVTNTDRGVIVAPNLLSPLPTVTGVVAPNEQPAARLGDTVHVAGSNLNGTSIQVNFAHPLLTTPLTRAVGTNTDGSGFDVALPSGTTADNQWPAGIWAVTVDLIRPGEAVVRTTNAAALLLAPIPVTAPTPTMTRDATTHALTIEVDVHPKVRPAQRAQLALGGDVALADPHPATTGTLSYQFGDIPDGPQWLRMTVDGVESLLVDHAVTPPAFDPTQRVTVPA
jgi:hypothetical protein